ncbi:MAG: DUF1990 domain-containing protein [Actinomycetia bacterium]|nr:DUF1990 domain-containing protein [Actinomycetes bacterium]
MSELTYPARLQGRSIPLAGGATYAAGPWHVLVQMQVIGAGELDFERAAQRITAWQMHRDAGVHIDADSAAAVGVEVAMGIGAGLLRITAECRVVAVVDEPRQSGFAYGTLARHPECGEEAFLVNWREDDAVVGSVAAFSQPARWYTKAGGPVTRAMQAVAARRYLGAMLP